MEKAFVIAIVFVLIFILLPSPFGEGSGVRLGSPRVDASETHLTLSDVDGSEWTLYEVT